MCTARIVTHCCHVGDTNSDSDFVAARRHFPHNSPSQIQRRSPSDFYCTLHSTITSLAMETFITPHARTHARTHDTTQFRRPSMSMRPPPSQPLSLSLSHSLTLSNFRLLPPVQHTTPTPIIHQITQRKHTRPRTLSHLLTRPRSVVPTVHTHTHSSWSSSLAPWSPLVQVRPCTPENF